MLLALNQKKEDLSDNQSLIPRLLCKEWEGEREEERKREISPVSDP